MPKLWDRTLEGHHRAVRDALLDATAALVDRGGSAGVTMSQVAATAGIGRATLYRYFSDVPALLAAWHERVVERHLQRLVDVRDATDGAGERLAAVLTACAELSGRPHGSPVAAALHDGPHVASAHRRVIDLVGELVAGAAAAGQVRNDVDPGELAAWSLAALGAARHAAAPEAVRRLVTVTLDGLRPRA